MNLKEFLLQEWVDLNLYKATLSEISDILIKDKAISQTVTSSFIELRASEGEKREEDAKKYNYPKTHKFLKNDLNLGLHTFRSCEPGTWIFDDCTSCDWHGYIQCSTCSWRQEVTCQSCQGKWEIAKQRKIPEQVTNPCPKCKWTTKITSPCKKCQGKWRLSLMKTCEGCNWSRSIQLWQSSMICQVCQWRWQVPHEEICNTCNGSCNITENCVHCQATWTVTTTVYKTETYHEKCTYCNGNGRHTCPTCKWTGELVCKTCHWERRTYQYTENVFKIEVKQKLVLLNTNLPEHAVNVIAKLPTRPVSVMSEENKNKLLEYSSQNSLKIAPDTIALVEGKLYELTSIKTWETYYVYNIGDEYSISPNMPKNTFHENLMNIWVKIRDFLKPLYDKVINPLIKWWKNKREY